MALNGNTKVELKKVDNDGTICFEEVLFCICSIPVKVDWSCNLTGLSIACLTSRIIDTNTNRFGTFTMRHILTHLLEALDRQEPVVIGGIIQSSGSAPRTSGARMLVRGDGSLVGSVGGGALEGKCQARATEMLSRGESFAELHFSLDAETAAQAGMICGGSVSVLLLRVGPEQIALFQEVEKAFRAGRNPCLLTTLPGDGTTPEMFCYLPAEPDRLPEELRRQLGLVRIGREPLLLDYPGMKVFVEPFVHPGTVYLMGAGHVAQATAHLAAFAGFEVVVMDDRAEFANPARYPLARDIVVLASFTNCLPTLGADDYVVIVTRGHLHDREVLAQALGTGAGYIGMIGSRRKRQGIYAYLIAQGFTDRDLTRVHSPIGLAIGADTPEEIGISIVAELIKVRATAQGPPQPNA